MKRVLFFVIILLIIFFVYIRMTTFKKVVEIGSVKVRVEIADNPVEQARGLMFRDELKDGDGMLFVFSSEEERIFWMKNMRFSLDMIFIADNGTIVDIIENVPPCLTETCPTYTSSSPARYVLEVSRGFSQKNNVSVGDIVKIP